MEQNNEKTIKITVKDTNFNYSIGSSAKINLEVEDNAACNLVEEISTKQNSLIKINIKIGKNCNINFISIDNSTHENLIERNIAISDNSVLNATYSAINSNKLNHSRTTKLAGTNSFVDEKELFFGNETQEFALNTNIISAAMKTKGTALVKGVLANSATAKCKGNMKIEKQAAKSCSWLAQHALLLSKNAKAEADPYLEIETNDVQAYHTSTVTPVDAEQVFYMTTRGIPPNEAKKIISQSFLNPIVESISILEAKEKIKELLENKWSKQYETALTEAN